MVNIQCPVCHFFYCLGSVEGQTITDAMEGHATPFRIDYRVWSGGRAKGVTQRETLIRGKVHPSLAFAWDMFVKKIEDAYKAVAEVVYMTPTFTRVFEPGPLFKVYTPGRLVIQ